jgi:hypothetical protein
MKKEETVLGRYKTEVVYYVISKHGGANWLQKIRKDSGRGAEEEFKFPEEDLRGRREEGLKDNSAAVKFTPSLSLRCSLLIVYVRAVPPTLRKSVILLAYRETIR